MEQIYIIISRACLLNQATSPLRPLHHVPMVIAILSDFPKETSHCFPGP